MKKKGNKKMPTPRYKLIHKRIASRPCTPPSTLEMFGEKINASPGSSKEIAGLLRKMMMMMNMMTRKL